MIRLYDLRTENNFSQRDMAKQFHISQATYHNWETGVTQPSVEQLIALSSFFGVSVDYLIGNSDDGGVINYSDRFLKKDEVELLRLYKALPVSAQKNILDFMNNINKPT